MTRATANSFDLPSVGGPINETANTSTTMLA
jgi:hypothetical protein